MFRRVRPWAAVAATLLACSTERHESASTRIAGPDGTCCEPTPLGEWFRTTRVSARALSFKPCNPAAPRTRRDEWVRVGVELEVRANSSLLVPTSPYYALLTDERGRTHEAKLEGCRPALGSRLLESGQSARGWISFDVPAQTKTHTLVYAPRLLDEHTELRLLVRSSDPGAR